MAIRKPKLLGMLGQAVIHIPQVGQQVRPGRVPAQLLAGQRAGSRKIPYFNSARMLLLKKQQASSNEKFDHELSESAVWISDRNMLHDYLKKKARSEQPSVLEEIKVIEELTPPTESL